MKKLILLAAVACVAGITTAHGQKVYKNGNTIVLDLSVAAGMPTGAVTTAPKVFPATRPSNSALWSPDNCDGSGYDGPLNKTMYHKLEVAPGHLNTSGAMDDTGTIAMDWASAVQGCRTSTYDGGGWRAPTSRELRCIFLFREALEAHGCSPILLYGVGGTYATWSATEQRLDRAMCMAGDPDNETRQIEGRDKTERLGVRCVRELP